MTKKEIETFCPSSPADWRAWLEKHHQSKPSIWLVYYRAATLKPSLTWSDAVDEALCFGWIDSTKKTIDEERYMQYFTPRKPSSTWSMVNKKKVAQLLEKDRIAPAGLKAIEVAKQNGMWTILDDVERLIIPADLKAALQEQEGALEFFQSQSKSLQKQMLYRVIIVKRAETRKKKIAEVVQFAKQKGN